MIDRVRLLDGSKKLVRQLVEDLRQNCVDGTEGEQVVDREYRRAVAAGRTALSKMEWAEGFFAQVAVAWVLGAIFVRFCEDNDLVAEPLLSGPGNRRAIALDHRSAYLQANPAHDDRHWLREIFSRYKALPATGEVFGEHNPIWLLAPSADGARQVVQYFQDVDPDTGELTHDFTDPSWGTRFLGDLYQDLSEHAKKQYALLQTPVFVEEFILDYTLAPALATFGLREVTAVDPSCGSGHFLLGIFARLFDQWRDVEPGANRRELARRSLDAIAGIDLNPFAASIARFRLLVAALRAGGDTRLANAPAYPVHIAVGDSLLHGDPPDRLAGTTLGDELVGAAAHGYATEDVQEACALLSRSWHVVVGNPPYIMAKDPALNDLYRARFRTCRGKYSLAVPFTERFFQLARFDADKERAGYVGLITANSFMKREMGKSLIENWFPVHDLTHVVDTSGAYIPGHGTPTVILLGRNRGPVSTVLRAVMSIRGEPSTPAEPEKGSVWSSIIELLDDPGSSNDYISVADLQRRRLAKHPWSIGGGGAAELKELLETRNRSRLRDVIESIGFYAITGEDDFFFGYDRLSPRRFGLSDELFRPVGLGEDVRDWLLHPNEFALFPYDSHLQSIDVSRVGWSTRRTLQSGLMFGKTRQERGLLPTDYAFLSAERAKAAELITFAFVATGNHFVLNRGGTVFNRTAPVIKLPPEADDRRHLGLVGALNSSTACFWLKMVVQKRGAGGHGDTVETQLWQESYEIDGTKLQTFPLPRVLDSSTSSTLDRLASELSASTPDALVQSGVPDAKTMVKVAQQAAELRSQMIAAQERLDWEMYLQYGLLDEDLSTGGEPEPPLELGQRAFEIVLARKIAAGNEETTWFARHGSTPITDLPAHWPASYKRLVERRIKLIETDPNIRLIERPEYKRRWAAKPWDEQVKAALRGWLLDRLESARHWPQPAAITTIARLTAEARTDPDFMQVARLYVGRDDVDVAPLVDQLVCSEAVPYVAALRYTDSGMRKYGQWLQTWDLQRKEDAGEDVGMVLVPPKYAKEDFTGVCWDHRGKLDVPKERFISYPGAERETDASLPVGWAGWDHLARARALATWYLQAKRDGRDLEYLKPLLAGLAELVPWLKQWYDEPNADPALNRPGSQIASLVDAELRALHLTAEDLAGWRPEPARRGRRVRR